MDKEQQYRKEQQHLKYKRAATLARMQIIFGVLFAVSAFVCLLGLLLPGLFGRQAPIIITRPTLPFVRVTVIATDLSTTTPTVMPPGTTIAGVPTSTATPVSGTVGSAACCSTIHIVQPGENLFRIAQCYCTTVDAIAEANNITNPNLIYVGQVLVIPPYVACISPTSQFGEAMETPIPNLTPTPTPTSVPLEMQTVPDNPLSNEELLLLLAEATDRPVNVSLVDNPYVIFAAFISAVSGTGLFLLQLWNTVTKSQTERYKMELEIEQLERGRRTP